MGRQANIFIERVRMKGVEEKIKRMVEHAKEMQRIALSFKNPLIVSHYDSDGLAARAVVEHALRREWKKYRAVSIKKLDDQAVEKLRREKEIIFVDLGSGNERVNELHDVLIIDHHQPAKIDKPQINPWMFGMDGGSEVSSSGVASIVFECRRDLAVVGALGDMQYPFESANRYVVEEGKKSGEVKEEYDITLYGRHSRPLHAFLAYSDEPYIPTISYNEENATKLLSEIGVESKNGEWKTYADLEEKEKKKLISALADIMVEYDRDVSELVGNVYSLPNYDEKTIMHDAHEFSTMLNACGRHREPDVGVEAALGNKTVYKKAEELLRTHKSAIREGIIFARNNFVDAGPFYFIDGRRKIYEGIIGIVCGMVMRVSYGKPVIGISESEEGGIKVSSRGNRKMLERGLNLGSVMRNAAERVGGIGGGHHLAAGAEIPKEKINEFLREVGKVLGKL
ncbi:MAG: DHH family phosphoesterase [Candidatus Micrarchaeia archaeon]